MSIILNLNDYRQCINKSQKITFYKESLLPASIISSGNPTNYRIGGIFDTWKINGNPGVGTTPGFPVGSIFTKSTTGAPNFRNSESGKSLYLSSVNISSFLRPQAGSSIQLGLIYPIQASGVIHVWDRIWQSGAITSNTSTNITTFPSLTRYTSGEGLSLWITRISSVTLPSNSPTSITYTITYKNQSDVTKTLSFVYRLVENFIYERSKIFQIPLDSGDTGIRSISNITESWSTAPATNTPTYNLVIAKYYGCYSFSTTAGYHSEKNVFLPIQPVHNDACLSFGIQFDSNPNWNSNSTILTKYPGCMGDFTLIEA